MKKYILVVLVFWGGLIHVQAQNKSVESARVAFISQKINLTPAQAEKFWPLYNELASQRLDLRKSVRKLVEQMALPAEQTLENTKKNIDQMTALKQKELALEKEYYHKYLLVISPKQFADLLAAEKEFQKILIKKVSEE